jgi:hypothetical protein
MKNLTLSVILCIAFAISTYAIQDNINFKTKSEQEIKSTSYKKSFMFPKNDRIIVCPPNKISEKPSGPRDYPKTYSPLPSLVVHD